MKKTPLYPRHEELKAKFAEFAGFLMPMQYQGVVAEHNAVREKVGIFDVSHMGRVEISGPEAASLLDFLSVSPILDLPIGRVRYTVWCDSDGGAIDDLLIYRTGEESFFAVFNASNKEKDLAHLFHHAAEKEVEIIPKFEQEGILAIQGPHANEIFPVPAKPMSVADYNFNGTPIWIASTGYTGSGGIECFVPTELLSEVWDEALKKGAQPIGLGARDTLRLEKGYSLYGHELSPQISPLESVSSWTVKGVDRKFFGKEGVFRRKERAAYGIVLDQGIAREGALIWKGDHRIGKVTSGTFSPSLKKGIALVLVDETLAMGELIEVEIRGRKEKAKVVPLPFYEG